MFELSQTVSDATHVSGHTLDLIITRTDETSVSPPDIGAIILDHFAVLSSIKLSTPNQHKKLILFRKVKSILNQTSKKRSSLSILQIPIWIHVRSTTKRYAPY